MIRYMMPCEVEYRQVECHINEIADVLNRVRKTVIAIDNFRILETSNSKRVILIMECAVLKNREE